MRVLDKGVSIFRKDVSQEYLFRLPAEEVYQPTWYYTSGVYTQVVCSPKGYHWCGK